jgi:ABC-2 type transport system ATP-binding protein
VLVQAVSQGADVLILDEPLSGLDAINRRKCLDLLLATSVEQGQTVIISSHLLNDVERIVDTIAVLNRGKLVTSGNLEELKMRLRRIRIDGDFPSAGLDQRLTEFRVLKQSTCHDVTDLVVDGFNERSQQWLADAFGSRVRVEHLNLEDIFVELSDQPSPTEAGASL